MIAARVSIKKELLQLTLKRVDNILKFTTKLQKGFHVFIYWNISKYGLKQK